ncbi:MAG: AsnC family protein [Robiginitomaculum sp.]|nr:AsnC family protein [Robiginitomaculum sp.]
MVKTVISNPHRLDDFDKNILSIVQDDNQLSHSEIGKRVGLSTSAVRRRLSHLQYQGSFSKTYHWLSLTILVSHSLLH